MLGLQACAKRQLFLDFSALSNFKYVNSESCVVISKLNVVPVFILCMPEDVTWSNLVLCVCFPFSEGAAHCLNSVRPFGVHK